jgi:hypothetical protein
MTTTFVLSDDKKKDDFSTSHGRLPMEERVKIWDVSPELAGKNWTET